MHDTNKSIQMLKIAATALAVALLTANQMNAQPAPAAAKTAEPADEMVVLSPFEVTTAKDRGYQSSSTAGVTRLATDLIEIPISAQILNAELLEDYNVRSLYDAIFLIAGGQHQGAATANQQTQIMLRGIPGIVPDDLQRDGFRIAGGVNSYNMDRIEILRGPNSAVNGASDPGGQVNVLTKGAILGRSFSRLDVSAGSYNFFRSQFDVNTSGKLGDVPVAVRVNAVYDEKESFIKFVDSRDTGLALALKARVTSKTDVEFKTERLKRDGNPSAADPSRWTSKAGYYGGLHTNASLNKVIPKLYNYDEAEATNGPNAYDKWTQDYFLATLTHSFSKDLNVRFEAQYAHENQKYQVANNSNPGITNIGVGLPNDYSIRTTWIWVNPDQKRYNLRAYANYNLNLKSMKQAFIVGASRLNVDLTTYQDNLWNPATNAQWFAFQPLSPGAVNPTNYGLPTTPGLYWNARPVLQSNVVNDSFYINATGTYLDGRVQTLLGISTNFSTREDYQFAPIAPGSFRDGTASIPAKTGTLAQEFTNNCPMVGVMVKLTDEWRLFANYSESYKPQTAYLPTINLTTGVVGPSLPPNDGIGYDIGVKFNLLDGKLTGSAAYYDVKETNNSVTVGIDVIAALLGPNVTQRYYVPGVNIGGDGWEIEMYYNPSRHWTIAFNYNYSDIRNTEAPVLPQIVGSRVNDVPHSLYKGQVKRDFFNDAGTGWFIGGMMRGRSASVVWLSGGAEKGGYDGYLLFGAFGGYRGKLDGHRYTVRANVENISDVKYDVSYAKFGEPRAFVLDFSIEL